MKITITVEYEQKKTLALKHVTFAIAAKLIVTASSDLKKYDAVHCTFIPKRRIYLCLIGAKLNVLFCFLFSFTFHGAVHL